MTGHGETDALSTRLRQNHGTTSVGTEPLGLAGSPKVMRSSQLKLLMVSEFGCAGFVTLDAEARSGPRRATFRSPVDRSLAVT